MMSTMAMEDMIGVITGVTIKALITANIQLIPYKV